jgi:transcriptional regulator with XRE-family HTH domain
MNTVDSAQLVRTLRDESGLSQRAFAARAETSGPTVAAYECGRKEPRLSTLERLAVTAGLQLEIRLVPADRGARRRARREARSWALAAATAGLVEQDYEAARRLAHGNIERMESVTGSNRSRTLLAEWRRVVDDGPSAVRRVLLDPSEHGHDMRQMTPFAGLMSDRERELVLDAVNVLLDAERAS